MAQELGAEAIALCKQYGFSSLLSEANIRYGFGSVRLGRSEEGIARMRQSLGLERPNPMQFYERYLMVKALATIGRSTEGLAVVAESLAILEERSEESNFKADMHHLKGDLLILRDSSAAAEAEVSYRRAIEIASGNSDKSTELVTATSLARLLAGQGKRDDARTMLAEIYNWFTEGFDTADLKDAKALLDELSA